MSIIKFTSVIFLSFISGMAFSSDVLVENKSTIEKNIAKTLESSENIDNINAALQLSDMLAASAGLSAAQLSAARAACYSALPGNMNKSIIMIPLTSNIVDLDAVCHVGINSAWHAGGVAKPRYFTQNCSAQLDNTMYGGGYTSYVTEASFESHRGRYSNCNTTNSLVCCSPAFPN